jgi:hypothetical protein
MSSTGRRRAGTSLLRRGGFESKAELAVLLAEYRRRAERLGVCPMSKKEIGRTVE